MFNTLPRSNASDSDFRDKNVNMRIPLKVASEGVKNADKAGSKTLSLIEFSEHTKDDVADRMKETVEQRTIFAEEDTEFFGDGKNTMSVDTLDDFKGHGSCALYGIEITAGRAETAFAAKRNEFERTTRRAPIHSTAESRIPQ